jgi:EAL domain-containing protein (putative c-di-GMP-specific phosphodiesterase class I)
VIGMEALARWNHPLRGWVSPSEFIPVAEDTGMILAIGAWVMEQACLQVRQWQAQFGSMFLAVNVSARQFHDPELVRKISEICQRTHFPFDQMHLEITESTLVNDAELAADIMRDLVGLGFRLSLDDFGTGYSSLSYLKRFPVQKLKIDQSFVKDLPRNPDDGAIVKAIVTLARALDMKVLAEGIETDRQHAVLAAMGCDQGQGYFYSQPLWARDFESFVFNRHQMLAAAPAGQAQPKY